LPFPAPTRPPEKKANDEKNTLTKVSNAILTGTLKHQCQRITIIFRLERNNVIISRTLQNLPHIRGIKTKADGPIATEVVKAAGTEAYGHQRDVGIVHGLNGHFVIGAIDVGFLNEIFQCFDELFEDFSLGEAGFEHGCCRLLLRIDK
jgi:hypothetical protein